jgi:hypothetical protein
MLRRYPTLPCLLFYPGDGVILFQVTSGKLPDVEVPFDKRLVTDIQYKNIIFANRQIVRLDIV